MQQSGIDMVKYALECSFKMQQYLKAASPFCVYDEWRIRCMSRDTCPDIPVWLKNGVSRHSYISHCVDPEQLASDEAS